MNPPETLAPTPSTPPPRVERHGKHIKRFDVQPIRNWLIEYPDTWCRIVGANDRSFQADEVGALRSSLTGWAIRRVHGFQYVEVQTRVDSDGGYRVWARAHTCLDAR